MAFPFRHDTHDSTGSTRARLPMAGLVGAAALAWLAGATAVGATPSDTGAHHPVATVALVSPTDLPDPNAAPGTEAAGPLASPFENTTSAMSPQPTAQDLAQLNNQIPQINDGYSSHQMPVTYAPVSPNTLMALDANR